MKKNQCSLSISLDSSPGPDTYLSLSTMPSTLWSLQATSTTPVFQSSLYRSIAPHIRVLQWPSSVAGVYPLQVPGSALHQLDQSYLTVLTDARLASEDSADPVWCPAGMHLCHRGCYSHCEPRVATHSVNRNLVSSMFPTQSLYKVEKVVGNMSMTYPYHPLPTSQVLTTVVTSPRIVARQDYMIQQEENIILLTISAPNHARVGEEISIEVNVKNAGDTDIEVDINIPESDQYQFVLTDGESEGVRGKTVQVVVESDSWRTVLVPIRPYKLGTVCVRVTASSGVFLSQSSHTMRVRDTGFTQSHHTSTQLDLTHNSYSLQYFSVDPLADNSISFSMTGDMTGPPPTQEDTPAVITSRVINQG